MDGLKRMLVRRKPLLIIAIGIFVLGNIVLLFLGRLAPLNPTVERSAASLCRRDYAGARNTADSAIIDDRVWEVDHLAWRRVPSCGELRQIKSAYLRK